MGDERRDAEGGDGSGFGLEIRDFRFEISNFKFEI
jgi:hypothetical protein